ncbi:hypothetical protein SAMN05192559_101798 [Halobacillus karajensis]|uniref:Uncharacterized protein n=1 Tax=Halobacillus karajensis TaxID=195088 RepID=A0A059NVH6_9BACI|nr:hypothetical protein [Halobacillus karajensis]CDQ18589.1 hypothetical protein BN982_00863 [Halobacillus karajensis]CDQ23339.1 hypothetical protein BN983_01565 [Halobacillus karajensis]CDQ26821.1 hypothetical protein BN981_01045 [Halobacillus karajensis]SEH49495.1 hypothetical protein SAMN05192559_101798 [Halobacillus karajensis]
MTKNEFEQFLSDSFREGISFRELRLSEKELTHLKTHFPSAVIRRTSEVHDAYRKSWYEVCLHPSKGKPESLDSIREENYRLKRELESLKKRIY